MNKNIHLYGLNRLIIELKNFVKIILFINPKPNRAVNYVNEIYDNIRDKKLKRLHEFETLNDFVFNSTSYLYPHGEVRSSMYKDEIVYGKAHFIKLKKLELIESIFRDDEYNTVIELGSGGGENLLWLAKKYKNINFIGLELSKNSVKLAYAAAEKYQINNIEFYVCDLTKVDTYKKYLSKNTFVYSSHTFEEMPRIYKIPLIALKNSEVKLIALLEPVYIFKTSRIFLDLSKLLRIINKDRLYGLKKFSKNKLIKDFHINILDLGMGVKPENPTTLITLKRK